MRSKLPIVYSQLPQYLTCTVCAMALSSCAFPLGTSVNSALSVASSPSNSPSSALLADRSSGDARPTPLWSNSFADAAWPDQWQQQDDKAWGLENIEVIADPTGQFDQVLRVHYPAESASPNVARNTQVPIGGAQFYADLGIVPQESLQLSYYVRFSDGFDFVKGGKLPGLYGGDGASGGRTPDGTDGFSTRFMWRSNGDGEVYAYLPTSDEYGTSIGRGNWRFQPGQWHHLVQEVTLNQPGQANGRIRVWLDGQMVLDQNDMTFRTVDTLKLNGIFFSTFFGGGDPSWATPQSVYADFAQFSVSPLDSPMSQR